MADMENMVGRATLPLRMRSHDKHVPVGTVQVDLDLDSIRIDDNTGELYALLDLNADRALDE